MPLSRIFLNPHFHDPSYIPSLLDICIANNIDVLLPVHHDDTVEISKYRQQFVSHGIRIPFPDYELMELAMDKYQLSKLARENRLSAPETLLASEISPNDIELVLGFPALIKLISQYRSAGS